MWLKGVTMLRPASISAYRLSVAPRANRLEPARQLNEKSASAKWFLDERRGMCPACSCVRSHTYCMVCTTWKTGKTGKADHRYGSWMNAKVRVPHAALSHQGSHPAYILHGAWCVLLERQGKQTIGMVPRWTPWYGSRMQLYHIKTAIPNTYCMVFTIKVW